jgi:hypothetical protein
VLFRKGREIFFGVFFWEENEIKFLDYFNENDALYTFSFWIKTFVCWWWSRKCFFLWEKSKKDPPQAKDPFHPSQHLPCVITKAPVIYRGEFLYVLAYTFAVFFWCFQDLLSLPPHHFFFLNFDHYFHTQVTTRVTIFKWRGVLWLISLKTVAALRVLFLFSKMLHFDFFLLFFRLLIVAEISRLVFF